MRPGSCARQPAGPSRTSSGTGHPARGPRTSTRSGAMGAAGELLEGHDLRDDNAVVRGGRNLICDEPVEGWDGRALDIGRHEALERVGRLAVLGERVEIRLDRDVHDVRGELASVLL